MQASSSGLVKADEGQSRKRPTPANSEKKAKKKCFWWADFTCVKENVNLTD